MIIQQVGTVGTASGKLTKREDVARAYAMDDGRFVEVWSVRTGVLLAEIDTAYSHVWDGHDGHSIGRYTGDLISGITLALGRPGYGYTHYTVKQSAARRAGGR